MSSTSATVDPSKQPQQNGSNSEQSNGRTKQQPSGSTVQNGPKGSVGGSKGVEDEPQGPGFGNRPFVSLMKTDADDPTVQQRMGLRQRHNQQGVIYVFVVLSLVASWVMGMYEISFLWVFGLMVALFIVWRGRMLSLTERYLRDKELELHRRRALRQNETSEWLNFLLNRWWVFSESSLADILKRAIDPILYNLKPAFIQNLELESFTLGSRTPHVKYLRVYEGTEGAQGGGGSRRVMTWSNVEQPPAGLRQASKYQLIIEANIGLESDDFLAVFRATLGGKWMGLNLDMAVEKLNLSGSVHMIVNLDMDSPFPHVSTISLSFLEKPSLWFSMRLLKAVNVMEVPLLKSFLHQLIMNGICEAIVDPGRIELNLESSGPTRIPSQQVPVRLAQGVLTVSITCEYEHPASDKNKKDKKGVPANPLDYVTDMRYCEVGVEGATHITPPTPGYSPWSDCCSFHVFSATTDKLTVQLRSKVMLTDQKIARFDIPLSSLQFEQKKRGEVVLQRKLEGQKDGEEDIFLRMVLSTTYTPLDNIEKCIRQGAPLSMPAMNDCVCGSLYICVHGASDLLGLDDNNLSDPYCFIYNGGKKVKSSHYVPRTRNPTWELATEIIVEDITKTMLSFIVYDWDGTSMSEDDFLGSTHVLLSLDEPALVRKKLELGYNLLSSSGSRPNDDDEGPELGVITVTVVFRPIPSIVGSSNSETSSNRNSQRHSIQSNDVRQSTSSEQHSERHISTSSYSTIKSPPGPRPSPMAGAGLIEISIIQATDLVAMDRNGFSDPFCEVKVNGKRHYVTSIKKRTLDPVWDETATIPLLQPNQTLEIVVWDHDAFFQKDFLGSISFTLEELKRYSADAQHDGWFSLHRITSGSIQMKFKVFGDETEDTSEYFGSAPMSRGSNENSTVQPYVQAPRTEPASRRLPPSEDDSRGLIEGEVQNGQQPIRRTVSDARMNGNLSLADDTQNLSLSRMSLSSRLYTTRCDRHRSVLLNTLRSVAFPSLPRSGNKMQQRSSSMQQLPTSSLSSFDPFCSVCVRSNPDQIPPGYRLMPNDSFFYYGVTGHILDIRGLDDPNMCIYYKVRLVNVADSNKKLTSSTGQVLAKSAVFQPQGSAKSSAAAITSATSTAAAAAGTALSRLEFEVDRGSGVKKLSRLVFDVKSGHFNHVAMRAFTLQEILGDADQEIIRWLPLEHGVEILVRLSHTGIMKVSEAAAGATLPGGEMTPSQLQSLQRQQKSHRSLGGILGFRRRRNSAHSIEEEK